MYSDQFKRLIANYGSVAHFPSILGQPANYYNEIIHFVKRVNQVEKSGRAALQNPGSLRPVHSRHIAKLGHRCVRIPVRAGVIKTHEGKYEFDR